MVALFGFTLGWSDVGGCSGRKVVHVIPAPFSIWKWDGVLYLSVAVLNVADVEALLRELFS